MTKDEFHKLLADTHATLQALTATKGKDYSRDDDQLANFKRTARQLNLMPGAVWLVLFNKHYDAIISAICNSGDRNYRPSEPVEGRIDDAILYLVLLKGLLREQQS